MDIFYDRQHITELCTLACGKQVVIKMTCLRAKQIFLTGSELYFSFELSVPCRKTMKMKFIATGHDIDIFTTEKEC